MSNLDEINLLKDAFFAKRVTDMIRGRRTDDSVQFIFTRILDHMTSIQEGKKQIHSGNLMENPVQAVAAYRKAIEIVSVLPEFDKPSEEAFNTFLNIIRTEVQDVIDNKKSLTMENLRTTYDFFREARRLAIHENTRHAFNKQEEFQWKKNTFS